MQAIIILGGGLVKGVHGWRTSLFDERDDFGVLGDRLRVLAGAFLFFDKEKESEKVQILACGGRGHMFRTIPDAPTVSSVIKKELITLGVPKASVLIEEKSRNTHEQLVKAQNILRREGCSKIVVITNRYHVPRVCALLEDGQRLEVLKQFLFGGNISVLSAEEVLLQREAKTWAPVIESAYATKEMKERILMEQKGVEDITRGVYAYTTQ